MNGLVPFAWSDATQAALEEMARAGATGREIAEALGTTRNAVLGRCHRTGVVLPMTARKAVLCGKRIAGAAKPKAARKFGTSRRGRQKGDRGYSDVQIAAVLAARMAGASRAKAARLIGCCVGSVQNWEKIDTLQQVARGIYERAASDAALRAKARHDAEQSRRSALAAANERVLAKIEVERPRTAKIARAYLAGHTGQHIGDELLLTRERVFQILAQAAAFGVDFDGRLKRQPRPPATPPWERPGQIDRKRSAATASDARVKALQGFARVVGGGPA